MALPPLDARSSGDLHCYVVVVQESERDVNMPSSDLKKLFEFVRDNKWCTARQAGRVTQGGKSTANHYLYGYLDVLFVRRGIAPPQWAVVSDHSYEHMMSRVREGSRPEATRDNSMPAATLFRQKTSLPWNRTVLIHRNPDELPEISVCQSCDLPIQPSGRCGCS